MKCIRYKNKSYTPKEFKNLLKTGEFNTILQENGSSGLGADIIGQIEELQDLKKLYGRDASDWMFKNIQIKQAEEYLKGYENRLDENYEKDLRFIQEMALLGDHFALGKSLFGLDQGTGSSKYDIEKQIHDIQYATGLSFEDLLKLIDNPQDLKSHQTKKGKEKRVKYSKSLKEYANINNDSLAMGWASGSATLNNGKKVVYNDAIHYVTDYLSAIFERPDILSYIKNINRQRTLYRDGFISNSLLLSKDYVSFKNKAGKQVSFMEWFAEQQGYDFLYEDQFKTIKTEINNLILHKFLSHSAPNQTWHSNWRKNFGHDSGGKQTLGENNQNLPGIDLSTAQGRQHFLRDFPKYFLSIAQDELAKHPENSFLKRLITRTPDNITYLVLDDPYRISDKVMADLVADFNALPGKIKNRLAYYQIVKDGFDYKKGNFGKIIGGEIMRIFSKFTDRMGSDLMIARQTKEKMAANPDYKPTFSERAAVKYLDSIQNEMQGIWADYLRNNVQLELSRSAKNEDKLKAPRSNYTVVKANVAFKGDQKRRVFTLLRSGRGESATYSRYLFPNTGIPYDGTGENIIEYDPAVLDNEDRISKKISGDFIEYNLTDAGRLSQYETLKKEKDAVSKDGNKIGLDLTIVSNRRPAYTAGDTIHFAPTGFAGIVTAKPKIVNGKWQIAYKMGNPKVFPQNKYTQHSPNLGIYAEENRFRLIDQLSRSDAKRTIDKMVEHFNLKFPNVNVHSIDFTHPLAQHFNDAASFVYKGEVYLNRDFADPDIAMEEFQHVWNAILEQEHPELIDKLVNELRETPFGLHVATKYTKGDNSFGNPLFRQELIGGLIRYRKAQRFGLERMEKQKGKVDKAKIPKKKAEKVALWEKMQAAYKELWDKIKVYLEGIFSPEAASINRISRIDSLDLATATVAEIADAMLNTYEDGGEFISMKTSADIAAILPQVLKVKAFDNTVTDFGSIFFPRIGNENLKENLERFIFRSVNAEFRKQDKSTSNYYKERNIFISPHTGTEYIILKSEWNGDEKKKRRIIKKEIVNEEVKYAKEGHRAKQFASFLSMIGKGKNEPLWDSALKTIRSQYAKGYMAKRIETDPRINEISIERDLDNLIKYMGFRPETDTAITGNDTKGLEKYGIKLPASLQHHDTVILIHDMDTSPTYSFIQMRSRHPNENPRAPLDINLQGTIEGLYLKQTSKDVQLLVSTLQAMAIKKNMPDASIRHIGHVGLFGHLNRNQRGFDYRLEQMHVVLDQVSKLRTNEGLINSLEAELRDIFLDDDLYNDLIYEQPPLSALLALARSMSSTTEDSKAQDLYDDMISTIGLMEANPDSMVYNSTLLKAIGRRQAFLEDTEFLGRREDLLKNLEYRTLTAVSTWISNYNNTVRTDMDDINSIKKIFMMGDRLENPLEKFLYRQLEKAQFLIIERYIDYHNEHDEQLKLVGQSIRQKFNPNFSFSYTLLDNTEQIFDQMWQEQTESNEHGQSITFTNGDIHWDMDNPATKALVDDPNSRLTAQMVKYGGWIMDSMENMFIDSIVQEQAYKLEGTNEEEIRESAKIVLEGRWRKGQMPIMGERFLRALTRMIKRDKINIDNREQFMSAFSRTMAKYGGIFDEAYDGQQTQSLKDGRLANRWLVQFPEDGDGSLEGNPIRQNLLGIVIKTDQDTGKVYYDWAHTTTDPEKIEEVKRQGRLKNKSVRKNIEDIMNFVAMGTYRAIEFDKRFMRQAKNYYAIREFSGTFSKQTEKAQDYIDIVKAMLNHVIFGELQELRGRLKAGKYNLDLNHIAISSIVGRTLSAMGANPRFAMKNVLGIKFNLWAKAYANEMSKNGLFTSSDWYRAITELFSDSNKIFALNDFFQVSNKEERAMLNHTMNSLTRKAVIDEDVAQLGIFYGDHFGRLAIMVAQLVHEGRYDAYSVDGKQLKYDITKDRKFSDENGNLTEEGKYMAGEMKKRIIADGGKWSMAQQKTDRLVIGHDLMSRRKYRALTDRYLGSLTPRAIAFMQHSVAGKLLSTFMTFIYPKVWNLFQKETTSDHLGDYVVTHDKDGKPVNMDWQEMEVEGLFVTLTKSIRLLKKHSFTGAWSKLDPWQKGNLHAAAHNVIVYLGGAAMIMILKNLLDKEDESPYTDFFIDGILYGAIKEQRAEFIVIDELYNRVEGAMPGVNWAGQIVDMFAHAAFIGDERYMKALVEGRLEEYLTKKEGKEWWDKLKYKGSLWIPGGSAMRDFRGFYDYYTKNLKDAESE